MPTKIEWADITINPVVGCSHCSPGCDHCYAERFAARLAKNPKTMAKYQGVVDEHGSWTGKINSLSYDDDRDMPHRVPGKSKRVFVGSMTDLFHPNADMECLDTIFASILFDHIVTNGHGHTYIVLTKRADRMLDYFLPGPGSMLRRWGNAGNGWLHVGDGDETFSEYAEGQTIPKPEHEMFPNLRHEFLWPLPNLWLGVTVCNQEEADEKIPLLLQTPAAVRFVSIEPMLGPVDLTRFLDMEDRRYRGDDTGGFLDYEPSLHWIICGGETGPGARPLHPDWVRSLRDQCQSAGRPFFFKSWGEWHGALEKTITEAKNCNTAWPDGTIGDGNSSERGGQGTNLYCVGKRRAGRLLDGREWNEMPEVSC